MTLPELVRLAEWKMARGGVAPTEPRPGAKQRAERCGTHELSSARRDATSQGAHCDAHEARRRRAGHGIGRSSRAAAPDIYPFFDEIVAAQVPHLGKVAWVIGYYVKYADALRDRARELGKGWTPVMVEQALWAHAGGKAGAR